MSDQVQEIKDRLSIVDVVGQYVQLTRAGKNFHARCPFHKERTPSFNVSPERNTYICFGCGEKGDIFSFVERIEGVDFKTALEELAAKAGIKLQRDFTGKGENKEKDARLRDACDAAAAFFEVQLEKRPDVQDYLRNRAVTDETKLSWRLGYAPARWQDVSDHLVSLGFSKDEVADAGLAAKSERKLGEIYDRFRGRIMFPIADAQGRIIAFSGRFFEKVEGSREEGEPAKYVNSPETALFKKSRIMYGFDKAKNAIRRTDCILLVEGQFDLVLCHQAGLTFAVAISGTALTPEHLSLLGRLSKRLVLALDADAAGVRSGLRSAHMALSSGFDVKVPTFPFGKDPADVAKENPELLKQAIRTSQTAVEFFLDALRLQGGRAQSAMVDEAGTASGAAKQSGDEERIYKKAVEAQVLPLIAAMESKIEQEHFVHIVAGRLNVTEAAVREEVGKRKVAPLESFQEEISAPQPLQTIPLDAIEKKAAMLLFSVSSGTKEYDKLLELMGSQKLQSLKARLEPEAEVWRFKFEAELNEHSSEVIAADMLQDIQRAVEKERFKMKFL